VTYQFYKDWMDAGQSRGQPQMRLCKEQLSTREKTQASNTAFQEPLAIVIALKEDRRTYQELDLQNLHWTRREDG
jgi:hypothetical protein